MAEGDMETICAALRGAETYGTVTLRGLADLLAVLDDDLEDADGLIRLRAKELRKELEIRGY